MIPRPPASAVAVLQDAAVLQQAHVSPADSVLVESPLPGGIAEFVRFLLNTVPPWVQMGGVVLAAIVAGFVLRFLFVRRRAIGGWLAAQNRGVKVALALTGVAVLVAAGGLGAATWNYTQHSNDFCTGCHVMNPAFQKFATGDNKHDELSCHDCHQQSLYASARQLYLWVAERPQEIREHAKVPSGICRSCHVTGDTARWARIAGTAGHRVHLESDSSALKDVQCVTCHGVEAHRFKPVSETCGTSGCHDVKETDIVLGKMAVQTVRHCTNCHAFTADVPALATTDSARGTMVPGRSECLGCHEMQKVLADFNEGRDPHGGKCGTCHNPHTQKTPAEAVTSCADCHADWREEPFHVGEAHKRVGSQCLTCHMPHSSRVDASGCAECHQTVRRRGRLRPPVPFDTARALRRTDTTSSPPNTPAAHSAAASGAAVRTVLTPTPGRAALSWAPHAPLAAEGSTDEVPYDTGLRNGPFEDVFPPWPPPAVRADTFPHARHAKLACLECHQTGAGHGRLTFERPRGCAICHHQAPTPSRCVTCHRTEKYSAAKPATVTVSVPGRQPNPRPVDFLHAQHTARPCLECHTTPVTLAASPAKAQCRDCHTEHHAADRTCSACHRIADPKAEHSTPEAAHQRCDACHTSATIAALTPTRSFCSTCHAPQAKDHYDARECTACHFLAEPGVYRSRLLKPAPG